MRPKEDINDVIFQEVNAAAQCVGIEEGKREAMNVIIKERILLRIGGSYWYARKKNVDDRDRQIASEFTGKNAGHLASKYGLSTRRINQIVSTINTKKEN